jgi:hypothetical protein
VSTAKHRYAGQCANRIFRFLGIHRNREQRFALCVEPFLEFPAGPSTAVKEYFVRTPGDAVVRLEKTLSQVARGDAFPLRSALCAYEAVLRPVGASCADR